MRTDIIAAVNAAQTSRIAAIENILERRRARLTDIHEDNAIKIAAPFDFQLDMLEEEISDVTTARNEATTDQADAFADL